MTSAKKRERDWGLEIARGALRAVLLFPPESVNMKYGARKKMLTKIEVILYVYLYCLFPDSGAYSSSVKYRCSKISNAFSAIFRGSFNIWCPFSSCLHQYIKDAFQTCFHFQQMVLIQSRLKEIPYAVN